LISPDRIPEIAMMMMRLLIPLLLLLSVPLSAQSDRPNCRGVLKATLSSGNEHPHLHACARELVPELAATIRESSSERDVATLVLLQRLGSVIRDPVLFDAALALANVESATPESRVLGFSIAVTQMDPVLSFQGAGPARPFEAPLSENCAEVVFIMSEPGGYWLDNGPPNAGASELLRLAEPLSTSESAPLMVRRFARCVVLIVAVDDEPSDAIPDWPDEEPASAF
jgi:hypothetical protein